MARAVILGGSGAIGLAVARRMLASGWDVVITGRRENAPPLCLATAGATYVQSDRNEPKALRRAVGTGADLLVDCVCFTAADARQLLPVLEHVGATVMMSSRAVYVDADGLHVNSDNPPRFIGPIREDQPTLPPGSMDYNSREGYGPNKVAAEQLLLDSGRPVTVLRASKVHGPGTSNPREWYLVRRVLDRRPAILLARRGEGIDHTSAAANIAALVETVATLPGHRILNAADPDSPTALSIARTISRYLNHRWDEVLLDGDHGPLGVHPWNAVYPIELDMSAARNLGYVPVGTYAQTVAPMLDWLVEAVLAGGAERRAAFDDWFGPAGFDYGVEDIFLKQLAKEPRHTYDHSGGSGSFRSDRT